MINVSPHDLFFLTILISIPLGIVAYYLKEENQYRIVRYMTKWAIQERVFLFWKTLIRYGDYYDALPEQDGKVIEFDTKEDAEKWLNENLLFYKITDHTS